MCDCAQCCKNESVSGSAPASERRFEFSSWWHDAQNVLITRCDCIKYRKYDSPILLSFGSCIQNPLGSKIWGGTCPSLWMGMTPLILSTTSSQHVHKHRAFIKVQTDLGSIHNLLLRQLWPAAEILTDLDLSQAALFLKGIVHPKMKIMSSFTHPQVVPNLYECVCSAEHKGRYSEEWGKQSSIFSPTMEVNGAPKQPDYKLSSEYLPLCSEQTHSYRFGSTWGWVNDDRIFIFGWTVSLNPDNLHRGIIASVEE